MELNQIVTVEVDLQGFFCNHWPTIALFHNDVCIHQGPVEDRVSLRFDLTCTGTNCLRVEHYGKRAGQDGIWDTDLNANLDCKLQIVDIRLNDVSIGNKLRSELSFVIDLTQEQKDNEEFAKQYSIIKHSDGWMTFNGTIEFTFGTPVYDWLILNKFQVDKTGAQAYFSGFSDRWNYDDDIQILNKIKTVMGFDENSNTSSTKT